MYKEGILCFFAHFIFEIMILKLRDNAFSSTSPPGGSVV